MLIGNSHTQGVHNQRRFHGGVKTVANQAATGQIKRTGHEWGGARNLDLKVQAL